MTLTRTLAVAIGILIAGAGAAFPQAPGTRADRLKVFIDCEIHGCDSNFFKTEIPFVDHVRDRSDSDVHVLVTRQTNGGGGARYTLTFIGRGANTQSDSLHFTTEQSATEDDQRKALTRVIKLGLVPLLAKLPGNSRLEVTYVPEKLGAGRPAVPKMDRWNMWVFRVGANSYFNGEQSQRSTYVSGSTSAKRITEEWKIAVVANGSYDESKFTFSDDQQFANYSHSLGISQAVIKSLTPHWSIGEKALYASSTYLNQRVNLRVAPAIEYNVFKYSEATRRMLTFQYSPGVSHYRYEERTVYGKLSETHPNHSLTVSLNLKQPWGSVSSSLEGSSLLNDFSKNHVVSYTSLNVRLFKGFNFNMYSGISFLRDQLHLPAADLTDEEILTRRRQLATSYSYYGGVGISYTFGSILNNIVNSRFSGSNGGFISVE